MTVRDIIRAIEDWAPPATAQSYDNVGLQIGRRDRKVDRVLVALDTTPDVVTEAVEGSFDLLITHHPLLFRPLIDLTSGDFVSGLALRLAEEKVALYAAHTNLDAAEDGVSFALAEQLGLSDVVFLAPLDGHMMKLVTFVPESHADEVRSALAAAGTGVIGDYDSCAFAGRGTGYFRPGAEATPFVGAVSGEVQSVEEVRLEVEVTDWRLSSALAALRASHPYEEVAYDVYEVKQPHRGAGLGAVGNLPLPLPRDEFLRRTANALEADTLRFSGPAEIQVERVAVCGGSGSELLKQAAKADAQAFVTADISYHRYFEVFDERGSASMLLVDAGHYETERMMEKLLADFLASSCPGLYVQRTRHRTGAMRHFVP